MTILITILIYFCILLLFSKMTSRKANNDTFYRADRRSPWYMVAFGMVGASISGITFVSVPGMVIKSDMTYLQMCLGIIVGYFLVAFSCCQSIINSISPPSIVIFNIVWVFVPIRQVHRSSFCLR